MKFWKENHVLKELKCAAHPSMLAVLAPLVSIARPLLMNFAFETDEC